MPKYNIHISIPFLYEVEAESQEAAEAIAQDEYRDKAIMECKEYYLDPVVMSVERI